MNDKVIVVTPPDDVYVPGIRILLIDINPAELQLISNCLLKVDFHDAVVAYVWKYADNLSWLFDKKLKVDHIFFNAESLNQELVGYCAAQRNSSYFGTLKTLNEVNKSAILSMEDCLKIFSNITVKYEQI